MYVMKFTGDVILDWCWDFLPFNDRNYDTTRRIVSDATFYYGYDNIAELQGILIVCIKLVYHARQKTRN